MRRCIWKFVTAIVASVLLSIFLHEKICDSEYGLLGQKKIIVQQMVQQQLSSEIKNHLESFKEMQKTSPLLQHTKYKLLAGSSPHGKTLLTVGISSMQHPHGSHLLDTLHSLFRATSEAELECIVVLVHLSDADPEWLLKTADSILKLFASHIRSRRLLVVSGLLGDSSLSRPVKLNYSSPCAELYSRQREGHALLMNFASQLSEYFLLLEDNTQFAPNFVSAIYWTLLAWKEERWVVLEFSSLDSGKVLHTSDLSLLTSMRLLFPVSTPMHLLLSKFHLLLGQRAPISFAPSLFSHPFKDLSSQDTCCFEEEEERYDNLEEPDNPFATIYTNMTLFTGFKHPHYTNLLNRINFLTQNVLPGDTYTLVFDFPHNVVEIQVLTGIGPRKLHHLEHGQVELGYEPVLDGIGCAHYVLLGPLVQGKCHQRVFSNVGFMGAVRCIRLLVTAPQWSYVDIRQINVWTKSEGREE
ncbi:alpha-1,3-mannosyl-glycoprotein 4-beta-N-acetylglucosaminyltransferase-like protein MGAT4E [Ochotona princeps]|uniref:alpha-1,3-mannosyl-glycoprotein 4-beta-N-acetylglucosaminyltransferase-like protein MGAT4E n=1 Tax=Ochotona princeps TaxID=9978 RepID=UPI00271544BF|nr:alpha-1,3-mannosyl-glycoprotein 4-beta-N-acetylglucosaminyltransferase-like protein MGAT4E [Ochotona princeps]XP_058525704.1 alpha-1,3-mannosyl-glycoprotein 4-beta-N-acetylglucosaminyltransferase-like protein MGAT4E [Ochotona princeps]